MMGFHSVADLARYSGNTVMYTGTLWNRNMILLQLSDIGRNNGNNEVMYIGMLWNRNMILFRVGNFRQKNYSAEQMVISDGIPAVLLNRKLPEFCSEPFRVQRIRNRSKLNSVCGTENLL
jgi:hypothetical protein